MGLMVKRLNGYTVMELWSYELWDKELKSKKVKELRGYTVMKLSSYGVMSCRIGRHPPNPLRRGNYPARQLAVIPGIKIILCRFTTPLR